MMASLIGAVNLNNTDSSLSVLALIERENRKNNFTRLICTECSFGFISFELLDWMAAENYFVKTWCFFLKALFFTVRALIHFITICRLLHTWGFTTYRATII